MAEGRGEGPIGPTMEPERRDDSTWVREIAELTGLPTQRIVEAWESGRLSDVALIESAIEALTSPTSAKGMLDVRDVRARRNALVHSSDPGDIERATKPIRPPVSPTEDLVRGLAPPEVWGSKVAQRVMSAAKQKRQFDAHVMVVDIRHSSYVMTQADDPYVFAATIEGFIAEARKIVWAHDGWFGNFTGDGFLAFWPLDRPVRNRTESLMAVLHAIGDLFRDFDANHIPRLAANSRNFRDDVAEGIGLDQGKVALVRVGRAASVVGLPVVGASRLADVARGWEVLANNLLGVFMTEQVASRALEGVDVKQVRVDVKDQLDLRAYSISYEWPHAPE